MNAAGGKEAAERALHRRGRGGREGADVSYGSGPEHIDFMLCLGRVGLNINQIPVFFTMWLRGLIAISIS